jgi:hypothetical protein
LSKVNQSRKVWLSFQARSLSTHDPVIAFEFPTENAIASNASNLTLAIISDNQSGVRWFRTQLSAMAHHNPLMLFHFGDSVQVVISLSGIVHFYIAYSFYFSFSMHYFRSDCVEIAHEGVAVSVV